MQQLINNNSNCQSMSTQYDLLSHRMFTLLSDSALSPSPYKSVFDTLWSSISFHNSKIELIEEQLLLLSSRSEMNSKLSEKVSLDEMMECLGSVNDALRKKVEQREVLDIIENNCYPRESIESVIRDLKMDIEDGRKTGEGKMKQLETNSKWQSDYFSKKIKNLKQEITQSNSTSHLKTYTTSSCELADDGFHPRQEDQKMIKLYEKQELKINTLCKTQQELQENIRSLTLETERILQKMEWTFKQNLEALSQSDKSITSSSIFLIELTNRLAKLESGQGEIQSMARVIQTLAHPQPGEQTPKFVPIEVFIRFEAEMNIIYKSIINDCIVGRWGYRNSNSENNSNSISALHWQYQMINTLSQNYIWHRNTKDIVINYKGIYQITLYIFQKMGKGIKRYSIKVNGKVVDDGVVARERKGDSVRLCEVLCVSKGSRVSVEIDGGIDQAILSLKKL